MVLLEAQTQVLELLEGFGAVGLQIAGDFYDVGGGELLAGVFGEVFVLVAGGVCGAGFGVEGFGGVELAAGDDGYFLVGLVAGLDGEVFDFADEGFVGEDFAEDDVFAVEVGGWDGGDEELGAVGAWRYIVSFLLTLRLPEIDCSYRDRRLPWRVRRVSRA